jgi:putative DNA primase/helicase
MSDDAIVQRVGSVVAKNPKMARRIRAADAVAGKGQERTKPNGHDTAAAAKELLVIRVGGGRLERSTRAAVKALRIATLADPFTGIYRRGTMLVRPARLQEKGRLGQHKIKRPPGQLVILEVDLDYLVYVLSRYAKWEKFDKRSDEWVACDASPAVAKAMIAAQDEMLAIPYLAGIVEAPTLRPDGSVLDRPGYDEATGLLFDPGDTVFPPVPVRPTMAQAQEALAALKGIVKDFKFVDEASRSVAISGMLTPLVRKACRAAPLHAFTAPKMASGKTLLATLPGYVSSGRAPAMMAQADNPAEEGKRLLAILIEGAEEVVLDNVEGELKSAALCIILTEPRYTDRLLGANKNVTVPSASTWFATGNNLRIGGDLTARSISCGLDPGCERPEELRFGVNLHEYVPAHRAELAVAALTIVRAYLAAGEPLKVALPNFARFENWSRLVRSPLVWLGMEDPCASRMQIEEQDSVRHELIPLLEAWHENYPGESASVADAIRLATRQPYAKEPEADIEKRARLADAMREVATKGGGIDGRDLGKAIAKHKGRIEAGLRFESKGTAHKVAKWAAVRVR